MGTPPLVTALKMPSLARASVTPSSESTSAAAATTKRPEATTATPTSVRLHQLWGLMKGLQGRDSAKSATDLRSAAASWRELEVPGRVPDLPLGPAKGERRFRPRRIYHATVLRVKDATLRNFSASS